MMTGPSQAGGGSRTAYMLPALGLLFSFGTLVGSRPPCPFKALPRQGDHCVQQLRGFASLQRDTQMPLQRLFRSGGVGAESGHSLLNVLYDSERQSKLSTFTKKRELPDVVC